MKEGEIIGNYTLLRQLGRGGTGEVWLARQETMFREVALKTLHPKFLKDEEYVQRFLHEAKMMAKFRHPNAIEAYDAGCDDDVYYMVMAYVEGEDVEHKLRSGYIYSEAEALAIARGVSSALKDAWEQMKMIHRDIKPGNLLITNDSSFKLMDLGIAKSLNDNFSLTLAGDILGTPYYISPEQVKSNKDLDFRTDIYALGGTLYHMLTGSVPFNGNSPVEIIKKHLDEPLENPRNFNSLISERCGKLIQVMMSKEREDRQPTWDEVIADIDHVVEKAGESSKSSDFSSKFAKYLSFFSRK